MTVSPFGTMWFMFYIDVLSYVDGVIPGNEADTARLGIWLAFLGSIFAATMGFIGVIMTKRTRKENQMDHGEVRSELHHANLRVETGLQNLQKILESQLESFEKRFAGVEVRMQDFSDSLRRLHQRMDNHIDRIPDGRVTPRPEGGDEENGIRSEQQERRSSGS